MPDAAPCGGFAGKLSEIKGSEHVANVGVAGSSPVSCSRVSMRPRPVAPGAFSSMPPAARCLQPKCARARGYVKFGLRRTLWTSLLLAAALGLGWNWWKIDSPAVAWLVVGAGCLALPAVALAQYAVEVAQEVLWSRCSSSSLSSWA